MLEAQGISLELGGRNIVSDIHLRLEPGTVTAVLGPNGAGKSSLLKLLSGQWKPTAGSLQLDGRDLRQWSAQALSQVRSVLAQESQLEFPFTGREVVRMGRMPFPSGGDAREDAAIIAGAIHAADVVRFVDRPYTTLSGGEKQRIHLARTLAQIGDPLQAGQTRLWFLDEPVSNLDLAHQHDCLRLARAQAHRGVAVLVVLHQLNLAMTHADTALVMAAGRVAAHGPVETVLRPDLIESVFGVRAEWFCSPQHPRPILATFPL